MGNNSTREFKISQNIPPEEVKNLMSRIQVSSENGVICQHNLFTALKWNTIDNIIPQQIWKFLSKGQAEFKFKELISFLDGMLFQGVNCCAKILSELVSIDSKMNLKQYFKSLLHLYDTFETPESVSWKKVGISLKEKELEHIVQFVIGEFELTKENEEEDVQQLLQKKQFVYAMHLTVLRQLFGLKSPKLSPILPLLTSNFSKNQNTTVLDKSDILFLNSSLPQDLQSEWSLLFSTKCHGLSFSAMLAKITNKGPTIFVVEDSNGHVFGGFASGSWFVGPKFTGDERCFLFKLRPFVSLYETTGYNQNFMYLNIQQQTLPNGLGMGGQLGYFGIWIDADFGKGHSSEGCSTFHHLPTLSAQRDFTLEHIEVWAVGPPPKEDSDEEMHAKRSILDKDTGAKALLEMVDRGHHSEGLREIPDDDE